MIDNKSEFLQEPVKYKTSEEIGEEVFGHLPDLPKQKRNKPLWAKAYHWIIDSGVGQVMMDKSFRILRTLERYADFRTGNGRISNERIARESGVYKSSVSKYLSDLEFCGVIKRWRKGWVRYYQIQSTPPADIEERVKFLRLDKYPKNTDTYLRDKKTGRFLSNKMTKILPKNTEVASP